jgi:DNA mismatch repair protein MSH4
MYCTWNEVKTLHHIHLHNPTLILIPDTFLSISDASMASSAKASSSTSFLVQSIQEEFPGTPVEPVARKHWNDQAGEYLIVFRTYAILKIS